MLDGAASLNIPLPASAGVRLAAHRYREASSGPLSRTGAAKPVRCCRKAKTEGLGRGMLCLAPRRRCKRQEAAEAPQARERPKPVRCCSKGKKVLQLRQDGAVGKVVMPPPYLALGSNA